jgi:hypothetical protein
MKMTQRLAQIIYRMPSKRYLAYIRSAQWERVKNEHLFRCDYICEICRRRKAIQVHHWTYARLGFERPRDLCAVCVWCHHDIHSSVLPDSDNDNQLVLPGMKATGTS